MKLLVFLSFKGRFGVRRLSGMPVRLRPGFGDALALLSLKGGIREQP